jgi:hypothetical protein
VKAAQARLLPVVSGPVEPICEVCGECLDREQREREKPTCVFWRAFLRAEPGGSLGGG